MPRGDGTGPKGQGPRGGQKRGVCDGKGAGGSRQNSKGADWNPKKGGDQGKGPGTGAGPGNAGGMGQGRGRMTEPVVR